MGIIRVRKYKYKVTAPTLPKDKIDPTTPIMEFRDMESWLNSMDADGWEFVGYGQDRWHGSFDSVQDWWIFRRPVENAKLSGSKLANK